METILFEVTPSLNMRTKWFTKADPLAVADVVMVINETRRGDVEL